MLKIFKNLKTFFTVTDSVIHAFFNSGESLERAIKNQYVLHTANYTVEDVTARGNLVIEFASEDIILASEETTIARYMAYTILSDSMDYDEIEELIEASLVLNW